MHLKCLHDTHLKWATLNVASDSEACLSDCFSCVCARADVPGRWEFRCNVQDHFTAGMKGAMTIKPTLGDLSGPAFPSYRRHLL